MTAPAPGRVLRLAVLAWGLGDLALGNVVAGVAWLVAEVLGIAALTVSSVLFVDTTWYLLPFLLGVLFLVIWASQAVLAYRRTQLMQGAIAPTAARSPALTIAWLALPLLLWATGFWLVAASRATPEAVMDRFMSGWPDAAASDGRSGEDPFAGIGADPIQLHVAATAALERLQQLCRAKMLPEDCSTATANLLRDVRVSITQRGSDRATAVADLVDYQRRPSTYLGFLQASELVPVPRERILTLQLGTTQGALGAMRWMIVNAEAG